MLRWGILATLIWHYTVDASLVGLFLVRSNSLYFKVSGAVVAAAAVAPLAFAAVSYLARGGFEAHEELKNRAVPAPEVSLTVVPAADETRASIKRYEPLALGVIGFLAFCLIAGGALAWRLKPETIGDYLKFSVNAREARARGDEILRQRGINPNLYHRATVLVNRMDAIANEFLRERVGIAGANEIYAKRVPGVLWLVRYFRDSEPEEFSVVLKPDGSLHSVHHTVAEAAAGASLSKGEAVSRAEKYLREEKKVDLSQWNLVEANSDKKPHRIDHELTWQENAPLDPGARAAGAQDHAYARTELTVLGDEVVNYRSYVKIPDEFTRRHKENTLGRVVFGYALPILLMAGLAVAALIIFLKNLRSEEAHAVPWRRSSGWALWALGAYVLVVAFGDRLEQFLGQYETAVPLKLMLGMIGISVVLGAFFYVGAVALVFGIAWYYAKIAFGEERIPDWTGMPAAYYRDALWIGLGGAAGLMGIEVLLQEALKLWPATYRGFAAAIGGDYDAVIPAASVFGASLLHGLLNIGILALAASFIAAKLRPMWLRALVFALGVFVLVGDNWGGPGDFAKLWVLNAIFLGVIVAVVWWIVEFNLLGGLLVLMGISLAGGIAELLSQPESFYRANGYGVILALVLLFAWPVLGWRMRPAGGEAGSGPS
jgi:hypothetical protein